MIGKTVPTKVPNWQEENPDLEVIRLSKPSKSRHAYRIGYPKPALSYVCHANNVTNMVTSMLERLLYVEIDGEFRRPPEPTRCVRKVLRPFADTLKCERSAPMERRDYPLEYRGRKRTIYEKAVESLYIRPCDVKDSYITQFIKLEKVKDDKRRAPRNISPRNPRYNVEVGKYLKPLEHKLYRDIASVFGEKVIFKGMNVYQQGSLVARKWKRFVNPVAVGLDASRFDQSVKKDILKWEHSIYLRYFGDDEELAKLLSWQIVNRFKGRCDDGIITHNAITARMSGDINTALGNCLIMCAMVYCYMKDQGLGPDAYALCNNGDDVVIILENKHLRALDGVYDWFLGLGFRMEVEKPVFQLEHIDFCQMHPIFDGRRWRMVRDFKTALSKDCVSLKNLNGPKVFDRWVSAVGECGLSITSGIPVVQNIYRSWIKGKALKDDMALDSGFFHLARGVVSNGYVPPTDEARISFYWATGITPDHQIGLEKYFDTKVPSFDGEFDAIYPELAFL